jgi:hypothetical protein
MMTQDDNQDSVTTPAAPKSLLALLARLQPLNEEFPSIPDRLPEPVEL